MSIRSVHDCRCTPKHHVPQPLLQPDINHPRLEAWLCPDHVANLRREFAEGRHLGRHSDCQAGGVTSSSGGREKFGHVAYGAVWLLI